jgi:adenylate cyclase
MAIEIERRFRISSDTWRMDITRSTRITQGYLAITEESVIRVRVRDAQGYLTVKSPDGGMARQEFEYPIPLADAESLLTLCGYRILKKVRHDVDYAGYLWEIDEYSEPLEGLILAEVELQSETADPPRPHWIGDEVTHDGSFSNSALAKRVEAVRQGRN